LGDGPHGLLDTFSQHSRLAIGCGRRCSLLEKLVQQLKTDSAGTQEVDRRVPTLLYPFEGRREGFGRLEQFSPRVRLVCYPTEAIGPARTGWSKLWTHPVLPVSSFPLPGPLPRRQDPGAEWMRYKAFHPEEGNVWRSLPGQLRFPVSSFFSRKTIATFPTVDTLSCTLPGQYVALPFGPPLSYRQWHLPVTVWLHRKPRDRRQVGGRRRRAHSTAAAPLSSEDNARETSSSNRTFARASVGFRSCQ